MPSSDSDHELQLTNGFSAGNYCSAYETQDYETGVTTRVLRPGHTPAYANAFILGFFSSYALHEIPADHQDAFREAYFSKDGQRVLELGFCDARTELE